jgi:hypothetical protein
MLGCDYVKINPDQPPLPVLLKSPPPPPFISSELEPFPPYPTDPSSAFVQ